VYPKRKCRMISVKVMVVRLYLRNFCNN